jgi:hypothetical protein
VELTEAARGKAENALRTLDFCLAVVSKVFAMEISNNSREFAGVRCEKKGSLSEDAACGGPVH